MKKALISPNENNRICQIEEQDFPVAEPLFWEVCPDDCTTEWTYNDGSFSEPVQVVIEAPPEPTKEELMVKLLEVQTQLASIA